MKCLICRAIDVGVKLVGPWKDLSLILKDGKNTFFFCVNQLCQRKWKKIHLVLDGFSGCNGKNLLQQSD